MRSNFDIDSSPPEARWMRDKLDRDAFKRSIDVLAVAVTPEKTGLIMAALQSKKALLRLPKIKSVAHLPIGDRHVLLNYTDQVDVDPDVKQYLDEQHLELSRHTIDLQYDYWTADDILHAILPKELCEGAPAGFAVTGHVAHMNLNDEYLPYKYLIGQVILDKNPSIRTVVNKLDGIDHQFRFFKMELLAGDPDYVVVHHESNCRFTFDFTEVYWNSRLHHEHERLVNTFKPEDVVADVFAGVGPFAIPAAKRGCGVLANDLNPNSAKYLRKNVDDNKVGDLVQTFCEDGREFIRRAVSYASEKPFPPYAGPKRSRTQEKLRRKAEQPPEEDVRELVPRSLVKHFVMNLPDSAITFLDEFRGLFQDAARSTTLPTIHCYCFTRELELEKAEQDIRQRVEEKLGGSLTEEMSVHFVRSVAPNKDMYCISFRLPPSVAYGAR